MEKRIDSPLCSAITAGDKEKVKQLLDGGANADDFQQETSNVSPFPLFIRTNPAFIYNGQLSHSQNKGCAMTGGV
jgi:hypothetical protein